MLLSCDSQNTYHGRNIKTPETLTATRTALFFTIHKDLLVVEERLFVVTMTMYGDICYQT